MPSSYIKGIGYYVPDNIVTNADLQRHMDTTDEWIQERTGIQERRYAAKHKETTSVLGTNAAKKALAHAGMEDQKQSAEELSNEEAREILKAIEREDQRVQEKLKKGTAKSSPPVKDW